MVLDFAFQPRIHFQNIEYPSIVDVFFWLCIIDRIGFFNWSPVNSDTKLTSRTMMDSKIILGVDFWRQGSPVLERDITLAPRTHKYSPISSGSLVCDSNILTRGVRDPFPIFLCPSLALLL
jgi:hypothetical protein